MSCTAEEDCVISSSESTFSLSTIETLSFIWAWYRLWDTQDEGIF